MDMLWMMKTWHGIAKLALLSDTLVDVLNDVGRDMAAKIRAFARKTNKMKLPLLPRQLEKLKRRQAKQGKKKGDKSSTGDGDVAPKVPTSGAVLNLATYKFHAHPHTPGDILSFGPTDNYSTQTVSAQ